MWIWLVIIIIPLTIFTFFVFGRGTSLPVLLLYNRFPNSRSKYGIYVGVLIGKIKESPDYHKLVKLEKMSEQELSNLPQWEFMKYFESLERLVVGYEQTEAIAVYEGEEFAKEVYHRAKDQISRMSDRLYQIFEELFSHPYIATIIRSVVEGKYEIKRG